MLEEAVPLKAKAPSPNCLGEPVKVMVWLAAATESVRTTSTAAKVVELPACDAVMSQEPAPVIVTETPETVQTAVLDDANETVRDRSVVAVRLNDALPKVFEASAANVMV